MLDLKMTKFEKITEPNFDKYDKLDSVDKAIINLKIEFPAITNCDVADKVGICRDSVAARLKKEKVKIALKDIEREPVEILLDARIKAALKMVELLDNPDPQVSLKACKEILKGVLVERIDLNINSFSEWVLTLNKNEKNISDNREL